MTTLIPFTPTLAAPFQFQPTLDGQVYNATVTGNLFGARYFLSLESQNGVVVFNRALIGSPIGFVIESLSWANGIALATTSTPHSYRTGTSVELTISGSLPDGYNGIVQTIITGPRSFQWLLSANPGLATLLGTVDYNVNLAWSYFSESTLVYRAPAQRFEVTP